MRKIGFVRGGYNPCAFWHLRRGIKTLVHGDDFVSEGHREEVKRLKGKLSERFEIKTKVVGNGEGEEKEARVLNSVIHHRGRMGI